MTGWNLPPGCNVRDIPGYGGDEPCKCCGHDPADCICPECPVCSEQGNQKCYEDHGLFYSRDQRIGQCKMHIHVLQQLIVDEEAHIAWLDLQPETWRDY